MAFLLAESQGGIRCHNVTKVRELEKDLAKRALIANLLSR
jgi:hypothetical protein